MAKKRERIKLPIPISHTAASYRFSGIQRQQIHAIRPPDLPCWIVNVVKGDFLRGELGKNLCTKKNLLFYIEENAV